MIDNNKELRELIRSKVYVCPTINSFAAIDSDGKVFVCGEDAEEIDDYSACASWSDLTTVSNAGQVIAIKSDGTVVGCGEYEGGECDVSSWTNIKKICAAYGATYGIKEDGTVVGCGSSVCEDILGKKAVDIFKNACNDETVAFLLESGRVVIVAGNEIEEENYPEIEAWSDIVKVFPEDGHVLGLRKDGTVVACGIDSEQSACQTSDWRDVVDIVTISNPNKEYNASLGITANGRVLVSGRFVTYGEFDEIYDLGKEISENWTDIVSIATSAGGHVVGLRSNGTVVACGDNDNGQCNVKNWKDIVEVFCGEYATIGVRSDGTIAYAGKGLDGCTNCRLFYGIDSLTGKSKDGAIEAVINNNDAATQEKIKEIAAIRKKLRLDSRGLVGAGMTYFAAGNSSGTVYAFGDKMSIASSEEWEDIIAVSSGPSHLLGVLANGNVKFCGISLNNRGTLKTDNWYDVIEVASSGYHALALHSCGRVSASGETADGRCNTLKWEDIVAVACGNTFSVGLKSDGTLVMCGDTSRVEDAENWTDIVSIACGGNHMAGLRKDGTVVACGNNMDGRCDTAEWKDITYIACGATHTVGVKADGSVVACGDNSEKQCKVLGWSDIEFVYSGMYSNITVGVQRNGEVVACGTNVGYQDQSLKLYNKFEELETERKAIYEGKLAAAEEERLRKEAMMQEAAIEMARVVEQRKAETEQKKLEEAQRLDAERQAAKKRKKRANITKAIVAIIVLAAAAVAVLFFLNASQKAKLEKYELADSYVYSGEYADAYRLFTELGNYEDAAGRAKALMSAHKYLQYMDAKTGDIVVFGAFEQDNNWENGFDPIEWIVLENKDGKLLLMSKYALDCKPYHTENTMVDWNSSSLRAWLNGNLYVAAFSEEERKAIVLCDNVTRDNNDYDTPGGYDTQDYLFLLDLEYLRNNEYFMKHSALLCQPSAYAKSLGAYVNGDGNSWWWLETPGEQLANAAGVTAEGKIYSAGDPVDIKDNVVRPALWLNTEY